VENRIFSLGTHMPYFPLPLSPSRSPRWLVMTETYSHAAVSIFHYFPGENSSGSQPRWDDLNIPDEMRWVLLPARRESKPGMKPSDRYLVQLMMLGYDRSSQ